MIKECCFFITGIEFDDQKFIILCIAWFKQISESLKSLLTDDIELDFENDMPKCSHQLLLSLNKFPVLRIRIFRDEKHITQHSQSVDINSFFILAHSILITEISAFVNLFNEAKNAKKH